MEEDRMTRKGKPIVIPKDSDSDSDDDDRETRANEVYKESTKK